MISSIAVENIMQQSSEIEIDREERELPHISFQDVDVSKSRTLNFN